MRNIIARPYAVVVGWIPDQYKQSINLLTKRIMPLRARAFVRRLAKRIGLSTPAKERHKRQRAVSTTTEREQQLIKDVTAISRALWMGFTTDALNDLEHIRRSGRTPRRAGARAAETLARWYATNGQHERALDRLIQARILNGHDHPERLRVLEHHLLTELGFFSDATQLFETWGTESPDLHLVQANLRLRQAEAGDLVRQEADQERLELVDWIFLRRSLLPISHAVSGDRVDFAALGSTPKLPASDRSEERVSVVVPAFNAEPTLITSVNSLRVQTYSNIEILIVDDSSTDDTYAVAKALESDDPRIKVFQHGENLGTYGARNTGLANATGQYFTVHDADDWSHPQLIERQLRLLVETDAIASFSRLARVSQTLQFLLRPYRPMLEPIHWNYTSLMANTATLRALGGWDSVRAHADSELIERLREYYGAELLPEAEPSVPMSFFLTTTSNLTESKETSLRSVDFGSRREYSEQARFWRKQVFERAQLPSYAGYERTDEDTPFYCTHSLAPRRARLTRSYDLIIGSDLALQGGTRRCNLAYIECARRLGLRIGIFNMPRYRMRKSGAVDSTYRELLQDDHVDLITPEDRVSGRALLVHHPPVLKSAFEGYPVVRAAKHYLLVNQLPWQMKDYSGVQYDVDVVRGRYERVFGARPRWIPISAKVRRHLLRVVEPDAIYHEDWHPIVNWDVSQSAKRVNNRATPVVGRHSRDHSTKWPEDAPTLQQCYLVNTNYEVKLLGGTKAAEGVLGYRPRNWIVYPFDSLPVLKFLQNIDIFIHFHHSMYIEEFGRNVAEAMALGIPCVLPREYTETFGDAAVYAEPVDVEGIVRELWIDPSVYSKYAKLGREFVEEHSGPRVGMSRIEALVADDT